VQLTAKQSKAYKQLMNEYAMESKKSGVITVVNEAARINKLIQVGAGFAYTKDGRGEYLDARKRLSAALEISREAEGKIIVFACYKWAVAMLERVFSHYYRTVAITGQTPKKERDSGITSFRQNPSTRVLIAHPGCMAHGINLQVASTIIWYTPTHSLETYMQANARITRPGQKQHMNIIHLTATPIERRIFKKLARNQKVQNVLLEMFKAQDLGV
jgi:SNF2 family DNA or RNA helicase